MARGLMRVALHPPEVRMKSVYLVEYSTLARNRIREAVARLGDWEVVGEAEVANDAVTGVDNLDPDVVITDLLLKEGTGVDVVRRIRARHGPVRPVIYVLTNRASMAYRATLRAAGANGMFDKAREYGLLIEELRQVA
jgi:DNA-binding NarL/FixJ family response regulator